MEARRRRWRRKRAEVEAEERRAGAEAEEAPQERESRRGGGADVGARGGAGRYWPPGTQRAVGPPAPMQVKPDAQSVLAAHGKEQRCV